VDIGVKRLNQEYDEIDPGSLFLHTVFFHLLMSIELLILNIVSDATNQTLQNKFQEVRNASLRE
jgi:hypothetical protein